MPPSISVLICDDHALVRSGLRKLLEGHEGFVVCGEAGSSEEAIAQAHALEPDVLLLDVTMPGRGGIEALPDLVATSPGTKVLMLSMHDDLAYVRQAFAAGATGYLLKDAADAELVKALREVAAGRRYVHPLLGARLVSAEPEPESALRPDPLSGREHDVLRQLALGHTNQEIASMLHLSIRTVETHRARIVQKLGLRSRAEMTRYALERGEILVGQPAEPR